MKEPQALWQPAPDAGGHELQPLPEHLIRLPGEGWALWRCVSLRGAGFPASQVLKLSAPECAAAIDDLFLAEADADNLLEEALDALQRELDHAGPDRQNALLNAMRRLRLGKSPRELEPDCAARPAVSEYRSARARLDRLWADVRQSFLASSLQISRAIREQARTDLFRQAVIWQNRSAIHSGFDSLLGKPLENSTSKQRRNEALVASYLQRYCTKNDTIGFFGPVGWARFVDGGEAIVARPGERLVAASSVSFEVWCIDALANALNSNKSLRPWIAPRLTPFARLEGTTLYFMDNKPAVLPAEQAAIIRACDGDKTAREIARELIEAGSPSLESEEDVYHVLGLLDQAGLVRWNLEAPLAPHPERWIKGFFERIEDKGLRESALEAIEKMECARSDVARAAGNAEELDRAIMALEATFTALTGLSPTRCAGQMYVGRTLVYEDCRRDIEVELGPQILEALGQPLSLLLTSARWFAFEAAALYRRTFDDLHDKLAAGAGGRAVELAAFWSRARKILFDDKKRPADSLTQVLQARWSSILRIPLGESQVSYDCEQLRPLVLDSFVAPRVGWSLARHHSPDVMIAASSPEAIRRGQYQLVLGEIHVAANTLNAWTFVENHPSPEDLYAAYGLDIGPHVVSVIPKAIWGQCPRVSPALVVPEDIHIEFSSDPSYAPKANTFPISDFAIERSSSGLVARTRDGRICFDLVEVFAFILSANIASSYKLLSQSSHNPRVSFDRLIVSRESWSLFLPEIEFAWEKDAAGRFVAARRWARKQGMPRFVFVKVPVEIKPCFVDFDSPVYVDAFARLVRRTQEAGDINSMINVTEMIPDPNQLWLPDALGQRYTSELRIIAVDLSS